MPITAKTAGVIAWAHLVVLLAMPRGGMHESRARVRRDVVTTDDNWADAVGEGVPVLASVQLRSREAVQPPEADIQLRRQAVDQVLRHDKCLPCRPLCSRCSNILLWKGVCAGGPDLIAISYMIRSLIPTCALASGC